MCTSWNCRVGSDSNMSDYKPTGKCALAGTNSCCCSQGNRIINLLGNVH